MNCQDARDRWHRRLDEGVPDVELEEHLASCSTCRRYGREMDRLVGALGALREETESVVARAGATRLSSAGGVFGHTSRVLPRWATGLAAAIAIVVGASLYFSPTDRRAVSTEGSAASADGTTAPTDRSASSKDRSDSLLESHEPIVGREATDLDAPDEPVLGITLRGKTAKRFLAVAQAASQPDVQVFWLYPTLGVEEAEER